MSFIIMRFALVVFFIWISPVYADETIKIETRSSSAIQSGFVKNGTVLAVVQLTYSGVHDGFQLSVNGAHLGSSSDIYIIPGLHDNNHRLLIKLVKNGSHSETTNGNGVIFNTKKERAFFKVITYGDQNIPPDIYTIPLTGNTIIEQVH